MLSPKRQKYRKQQRGRNKGLARRGIELEFGQFGLQAVEHGFLDSRQIEAARICISRYCKRTGKMWIRVFPDKPYTSKPIETRMGKGKGAPDKFIVPVKPGRILYELEGVSEKMAIEALKNAGHKLPLKTKPIKREETIWK